MRMLSLFSGIEGIGLAAERCGIELAACCEIEPYAVSILKKRHPGVRVYGDIRTITKDRIAEDGIGKIDILAGGFPCQPFSCAGQRKGQEDDRYLWPEMLRLVGELKPKWVLGENVAGLLSIADVSGRRGGTFQAILYDLASMGYRVGWTCYGAGDIGAPHQRDRVFIVAHAS